MVLVAGIIMFVLWLSLPPHRPFFLDDFTIPNFNRQSGAVNLPVSFTVDERNPNQKIGIHYDTIYGSVYYNDLLIASRQAVFNL
uniref:Late embryogenesis abundant protein LEA-2 subgroup domain-containing protein n=1 Tax=Oryza punctata TaxID=4537 RepID=A0A0E0KG99_ORYPU